MVGKRPVRRRPSPPVRWGSVPRLQGTCAVLRRTPRRRAIATCLTLVVATVVTLTLPNAALAAPETRTPGAAIEVLSPYQGQTICDPVARPGVTRFKDLVLATYAGTADAGLARACSTGGSSEHKEGRAWDWRVSTSNPTQAAQARDLLTWLLATDVHGNTAAMARRLGVMYVIWDRRVWKSYQASLGWQAYTGASPHTDHVHVSFSWAGASGETSYWTGKVAPVMNAPSQPSPSTSPTTSTVLDRSARTARRKAVLADLPGPWKRH